MSLYQDLGDALILMQVSPLHSNWGTEQICRCVLTPIDCGQYGIMRDERGFPVVFGTWATPTEDQINEYLHYQEFPIEGYIAKEKSVWMIDFISKKDYTLKGVRYFKKLLREKGFDKCLWLRLNSMKIGWHRVKGK